jgi:hypothetical protein
MKTQIEIRTGEICENLWPVSRLVPRPVRRLR